MNDLEILGTITVALIAALPGIIAQINIRRLQNASAANEITEGASKLIRDYRARLDELEELVKAQGEQITRLEAEVKTLRRHRREYRRGLDVLTEQVKTLGATPRYCPPEDEA